MNLSELTKEYGNPDVLYDPCNQSPFGIWKYFNQDGSIEKTINHGY